MQTPQHTLKKNVNKEEARIKIQEFKVVKQQQRCFFFISIEKKYNEPLSPSFSL